MPEHEIDATVAALSGGNEPETPAPEKPPAEPEAATPAPKPAASVPGAPREAAATAAPNATDAPNATGAPAADGSAAQAAAFEALKGELGDVGSLEQMKLQLADAQALYQICYGKADPAVLLDVLKSDYPEAFQRVAEYFAKGGDGAPPKPDAVGGATGPDAKPSLEDRVGKIEQAREQAEMKARGEKTVKAFLGKVGELGKAAHLSEKRIERFGDQISAVIGRDAAAVKRLEAGNFADVERWFNELHNEFVSDLEAHNKGLIERKEARDRALPKSPAGGAPPASAGAPGRPKTREERMAAVTAELNS